MCVKYKEVFHEMTTLAYYIIKILLFYQQGHGPFIAANTDSNQDIGL